MVVAVNRQQIILTHGSVIARIAINHQITPDFRKGVDGFVALCKNRLLLEPRKYWEIIDSRFNLAVYCSHHS